ncbi:DUF4367 domain-containing protein [Paenibacillus sp. MER TA 81-3]|uniref:DUF4367 domain-containing protein n=1 Tax=Paenibacillus sp. MER TA 81-3 TaxID=2939573 RepID=UPI00203F5826|nr:DUF4367 domain-containing protein [Paenibacillus sp. MER TA 81-3]MCM3341096.1 DUF4367 domain-containing protein [Paenibacillus sp. MER TA 81-3]
MNKMAKMTIGSAVFTLVFSYMTGYAGAAGEQSKHAFSATFHAAKSKTSNPAAKKSAAQQKKEALAIFHAEGKKPGDLFVLYDGSDGTLSFNYLSLKSSKLDDYAQQSAKYKAPVLQQPEALPEGYEYHSSEITPPFPQFLSEPYQKMLKELKAEAKGKMYYAKKLKWSEAGESQLIFFKDSDIIRISVKKLQPIAIESTRVAGKGETIEKLSVKGIDAMYITGSDVLYSTMLQWEDAEKKLQYQISLYKNSPLTKEDLIAIAESIMQG